MNVKEALDVIDCELTQMHSTLCTLKRCVVILREDSMTADERMLKELHDEHEREFDGSPFQIYIDKDIVPPNSGGYPFGKQKPGQHRGTLTKGNIKGWGKKVNKKNDI